MTADGTGDLSTDCIVKVIVAVGVEARGEEADTLSGEATTVRVGEGTEAGSGEGAGDGLSGVLTGGDRLVFSGSASSGRKGSVKKRLPGDLTGVT